MFLKTLFAKKPKNPLDQLLDQAIRLGKSKFLIIWNRGLGDIPLGLYALVHKIKEAIPHAAITFLTREDLRDVFLMMDGVNVLVDPRWKRGEEPKWHQSLFDLKLSPQLFDCILDRIDGDKWLKWQIGSLTPKLKWSEKWDALIEKFLLDEKKEYLGVHLNSETSQFYGYEKNWPTEYFQELFAYTTSKLHRKILLFGFNPEPIIELPGVIDLRGKTSLFEMLSIIKNRCSHFLGPDSGVLSVLYYIDDEFYLRMVSLWADSKQGILKQKVASPNRLLDHKPLRGEKENVANISVKDVLKTLFPESF